MQIVWHLVKDLWPYRNIPWPEIILGTILGCGSINLQSDRPRGHHPQQQKKTTHCGLTQLLQILISESMYLIWVLRCEQVIQEKLLSERKIKIRWYQAINERLTINKVTVMKIKRNDNFIRQIEETWGPMLSKEKDTPANWIYTSEVLVGRTA